ncbi:U4/U6 small nuclear ribonucleoprotein PRP31, putative [Plasmodium reichenowi]|uniref:U4/U6 small nuclear ribonucleoprotein PRP31, putative n=1 Tax=Plasmodium reichenowi TaxID=5854 RepID=A0A151LSD1_PLARE|nr:U4/U6 small nuclear ribonucleoprotein PRP31, putative [Plasmodium reichenowi]KYO02072.1 U4/U6 small nuclear ribonucleoprotein PRP31, putative [Plasmodium reichenowi]
MATLADSFLKDLEDLEFEEEEEEEENNIGEKAPFIKRSNNRVDDEDNDDYEEIVDAIEEFLNEKKKNKERKISELLYDEEFLNMMNDIKTYMFEEEQKKKEKEKDDEHVDGDEKIEGLLKERERDRESKSNKINNIDSDKFNNNSDEDNSYDDVMIEKCMETILRIDTEILNIHKYVKDIYSTKFPELDSIVYSPVEYISVVNKIRNEVDLKNIDFSDILPNTTVMAITVASSMTTGICLPDHLLKNCISFCNEGIQLNEYRNIILLYLESKMFYLAPNVTMLLGSSLTARLISAVGSLKNLSIISSQNLIVIASTKKSLFGLSNVHKTLGIGILCCSEIVQSVPDAYKKKAISLLASKCSLAARIDYFKKYKEGQYGLLLRQYIISHLIKLQEPPPLKQKKILPMPDEKRKRKRGGKRYRKLKEKTQITELTKQINRLPFGPETTDDFYNFNDQNTILLNSNITKLKYTNKQKNLITKKRNLNVHSSGATGGLSSSLIFTPLQGIELYNPSLINKKNKQTENKYFSNTAEFRKI